MDLEGKLKNKGNNMRTIILTLLNTSTTFAQSKKQIEVLTLGSFHFNFPNLDVIKTSTDDKIDILDPKYQKEIVVVASI